MTALLKSLAPYALLPVLLWAGVVLLLFVMQDRMVFLRLPQHDIPLPAGTEALRAVTPDGDVLHGHRIAGNGAEGERALVIGFGGNGWDARATLLYMRDAFPAHDVAAFHFRGYRPSEGRPSAAALMADARLIHDQLAQGHDGPVLALGVSLGSGVAAHLAGARDLDGVILLTAFDDLTEVARQSFPWAPVRSLFRHPMPAAEDLARSTAPVALINASSDPVIPTERTAALRDSLDPERLVLDVTIPGDHNAIHSSPETRTALRRALERLLAPPGG